MDRKDNRRTASRFFLLGAAKLRVGAEEIPVTVLNRSQTGVFVLSPRELPLGGTCELNMPVHGRRLTASCEICRVDTFGFKSAYLSGVRVLFSETDPQARERFERFHRELLAGIVYGQAERQEELANRTSKRMSLLLRANIAVGGRRYPAVILNISEHGMGILSQHPLSKGTTCLLEMELPDIAPPATLAAQVAWTRSESSPAPIGVGLRMANLNDEDRKTWTEDITEDIAVIF